MDVFVKWRNKMKYKAEYKISEIIMQKGKQIAQK